MSRRAIVAALAGLALVGAAGCGGDDDISEAVESARTEAEARLDEARADLESKVDEIRDEVSADVEESLEDVRRAIDDVEIRPARSWNRHATSSSRHGTSSSRRWTRRSAMPGGLADALDAIERMLERIEDELRDLG